MKALQFRRHFRGLRPAVVGFLRCLAAAFFLLFPFRLPAEIELPARPENHLLDQGEIFPEDAAKRIVASLATCVRDHDLHIYVVTMPPKAVMPARNRGTFDETWKAARVKWLGGKVGAVILFDNEAGWSAIGASEEAKRILPPEPLSTALKNPELQSKKKHLSPEQLEGTVAVLIRELKDLRMRTNVAERRRTMTLVIGASVAVAVFPGVGLLIAKKRKATHGSRHRHYTHVSL